MALTAAQVAVVRLRFTEPELAAAVPRPVERRRSAASSCRSPRSSASRSRSRLWIVAIATHDAARIVGPLWVVLGVVRLRRRAADRREPCLGARHSCRPGPRSASAGGVQARARPTEARARSARRSWRPRSGSWRSKRRDDLRAPRLERSARQSSRRAVAGGRGAGRSVARGRKGARRPSTASNSVPGSSERAPSVRRSSRRRPTNRPTWCCWDPRRAGDDSRSSSARRSIMFSARRPATSWSSPIRRVSSRRTRGLQWRHEGDRGRMRAGSARLSPGGFTMQGGRSPPWTSPRRRSSGSARNGRGRSTSGTAWTSAFSRVRESRTRTSSWWRRTATTRIS